MDDSSHRENGRHKPPQGQWLMHHQPSMKQIMSIMAERDAAIQERNLAISEKKSALAERDMAVMQRDSAISERNNAIIERDNAIATLHYRDTTMNNANISPGGPACQITSGAKHIHHPHHHHPRMVETPYANRDIHIPVTLPMPPVEPVKPVRTKRAKEAKPATPAKRVAKSSKRVKRASQNGPGPDIGGGSDDLTRSKPAWKEHDLGLKNGPGPDMGGGSDDLNRAMAGWKEHDLGLKNGPGPDTGGGSDDVNRAKPVWKEHDLGLNQVAYDETMPVPVCSCTGVLRACYKWGNGGWQSSCCTTNLSMYPLPAVPNKRHARVGGRKMSGSAFNKLLSRLASEGHDLSNPVDLKDRWARHGTNRYITIK